MQTIRLRVNEKVYQNLMWFLRKFTKEELEIIEEDDTFTATQKELRQDLTQLENGEADFIDLDQLDQELENTLKRYEA
ncbi:tRNA pseudouridine synthase A [Rufibacter roseolus]|uniref:tRNA pseudouridine synthase A n=1 Tax=Rufibacter roseolus TaxID=2817375 RepID=UPI001B309AD3|nr:tRNA pseudouridine synthase A [Rufibacter roseolus]